MDKDRSFINHYRGAASDQLPFMKNFEHLYNFCGTFEKQLKADYKKHQIHKQKINFAQFCILAYLESIKSIK